MSRYPDRDTLAAQLTSDEILRCIWNLLTEEQKETAFGWLSEEETDE